MREQYLNELAKKYGLPSVHCVFNPDVYWFTLEEAERTALHYMR